MFQRVLKLQTGQIFHINGRLVKGGGAERLGRFSGGPVIQNLFVMHLKVVVVVIAAVVAWGLDSG